MRRALSPFTAKAIEIVNSCGQPHFATAATSDPRQDLLHGWHESKTGEFSGQVLLHRLAGSRGTPLKAGVDIVRKISNQYILHDIIMISIGC